MAIVTVSHEMGSGGAEIGAALAERLGYRYVDQDMITQAAHQYGVGEEKLTQLDETKPSCSSASTSRRASTSPCSSRRLDVAENDNGVLMGRGGQVLLRGIAHVLRVRVTAPFDMRVKRVVKKMAGQMGESVDVRTTAEMLRRNEHEKYGRMRYLYDVDWGDPALYDVVFNTEKLSCEAGVDVILGCSTAPSWRRPRPRARRCATGRFASRVRTALAAHHETRKYRINVEADRGVIQLEGTAALDRASEVARTVAGVVDVKAQLLEVPPIPPFVA
jgi:cytidylate kinase